MRKLFSIAVGIWLSINCWGQNPTSQFRSSNIDPLVSRHYITWEERPNARYEVHLYSKDADGNEIPVETIKAERNYTKINVALSINTSQTKLYFKTIAIDRVSGGIIDIGIEVEFVPEDAVDKKITCFRECVGPDYAWRLNWLQKATSTTATINPQSPGALVLSNAYQYRNEQGDVVPYYQAMSIEEFRNWYDRMADIDYKFDLNWSMYDEVLSSSDCVLDGAGRRLEGRVWFVEKKLGLYGILAINNTDFFNHAEICNATSLGYWIDLYNTKSKETEWYQWYTDTIKFPDNSPLPVLGCLTAPSCGGGSGGGTKGDGKDPSYLNKAKPASSHPCSLYYCPDGSGGFTLVVGCDGNPCNSGGTNPDDPDLDIRNIVYLPEGIDFSNKKVKSYQFERLDKKADRKIVRPEESTSFLLEDGLYRLYVVLEDFSAVPVVFEYKSSVIEKHNNYARLDVTPNPIQEKLRFQLSSEINTTAIVNIYTLAGDNVYTETVNLIKGKKLNRMVDLNQSNALYNQWRVVVSFPDGTSIQRTAIR
jgi:hypothetical protein